MKFSGPRKAKLFGERKESSKEKNNVVKMTIKTKNKKAMFFTFLAIAMLSLFLISYTFYFIVGSREAVSKRIETMNNFVFSVEQDLPRQLYISGFRMLFLFEKRITETGDYIDDLSLRFNETFFAGTLYGQTNQDIQTLMDDVTFPGMQKNLQEKASKINAIANLTNPSLSVIQENPWNVKISLTADLSINDSTNLVSWKKTVALSAYIPIENFNDPAYIADANGFTNKINKTVYEPFVNGADVSNLALHVENSHYIASTSAPSFLDRLDGNLTGNNENGIESLVDRSEPEIPQKDKSVVDYIYFSEQNPTSHHIQGMPSWFRIDDSHLSVYGVEGLTTD